MNESYNENENLKKQLETRDDIMEYLKRRSDQGTTDREMAQENFETAKDFYFGSDGKTTDRINHLDERRYGMAYSLRDAEDIVASLVKNNPTLTDTEKALLPRLLHNYYNFGDSITRSEINDFVLNSKSILAEYDENRSQSHGR